MSKNNEEDPEESPIEALPEEEASNQQELETIKDELAQMGNGKHARQEVDTHEGGVNF